MNRVEMKTNAKTKQPFKELADQIQGEVHADPLRRYLLSTDASIFQKMPAAVIYPRCTQDVQTTVKFAIRNGLHLHPRGAGSGLCGSAVGNGLVVDFTRFMNRLIDLDVRQGSFECEPGLRFGELEAALRGKRRFFPPDPSSGEYATFGGMCATNASGAHSVKYGNVVDYLLDAELVFADGSTASLGEIQAAEPDQLPRHLSQLSRLYGRYSETIENAYPGIACNVAGYNLRGLVQEGRLRLHRLLCGAEGTLALATRLRFRLIDRPAADSLVVAFFDDILNAARAVQYAMTLAPSGIEIMDKSLLRLARASDETLRDRIPADVDNVLLIEFDGASAEASAGQAETLRRHLESQGLTDRAYEAVSGEEKERFWALRKAAVPTLYKLKGRRKILALVEDAAVPIARLTDYFAGIYSLFERLGVSFVIYGHIAKGLMHTRPLLDLKDPDDVALLQPIADGIYELVDGLGGTVSGEHGDGRLRSAYVQRKYPDIYDLFVRTKQLLDPQTVLNPEIKTYDDPGQMARHLRYGGDYHSQPLDRLRLQWHDAFVEEAERCHGCSKCTTVTAATRMCPVYKVTRDEAAAPKAKANALRALISGALPLKTLYRSALQHVMAQCVNCGSCYIECPSNVNIPKLAMEAKAQYARRFGVHYPDRITAHVELMARTTHRLAPVIKAGLRIPYAGKIAMRAAGLAPQREMVLFDRRSLYQRVPALLPGEGPRVLYYAGCYAGYIRPELGIATMDLLHRMGMKVHLPSQACCGLPQLSKGLVTSARRAVRRNLAGWQDLLADIDWIAVTCSSCGYALMQDWSYLLDRSTARKVSAKTIHISRLIGEHADRLAAAPLAVKLAYHHPCHLRIQPESRSSLELLGSLKGVQLEDLQSNCCGIAGSWGIIRSNYELSRTIGTPMIQRLNASGADVGITDCPTCQMQMEHMGRLPVRHPVEMVWEAVRKAELST